MKFLKKNVKKKNVEILEENGLLLLIFKLWSNLSLFLNYLSVSPCFKTWFFENRVPLITQFSKNWVSLITQVFLLPIDISTFLISADRY